MQRPQTCRSSRCDPNTGRKRRTGQGPSPAERGTDSEDTMDPRQPTDPPRRRHLGCPEQGSVGSRPRDTGTRPPAGRSPSRDPFDVSRPGPKVGTGAQGGASGQPGPGTDPQRPSATGLPGPLRGQGTKSGNKTGTCRGSQPVRGASYLHELPHGDGPITWTEGAGGRWPLCAAPHRIRPPAPRIHPHPPRLGVSPTRPAAGRERGEEGRAGLEEGIPGLRERVPTCVGAGEGTTLPRVCALRGFEAQVGPSRPTVSQCLFAFLHLF